MNYNRIILAGNVTREVELRHTQGGMAIAKIGLAVNRKSKDKETTCFVDCTAFGKSAEILAEYVRKGSSLLVEGRLELETWEDKEGNRRSKHGVVVDNFQLGQRGDDGGEKPGRRSGGGRAAHNKTEDDYGEYPF